MPILNTSELKKDLEEFANDDLDKNSLREHLSRSLIKRKKHKKYSTKG